jgi:hypothetical protein
MIVMEKTMQKMMDKVRSDATGYAADISRWDNEGGAARRSVANVSKSRHGRPPPTRKKLPEEQQVSAWAS